MMYRTGYEIFQELFYRIGFSRACNDSQPWKLLFLSPTAFEGIPLLLQISDEV
jgi:hypothetical protein